MIFDVKNVSFFCDVVSDRVYRPIYQNLINSTLKSMKPYEGVALPSKVDLHCVVCPELVDPLELAVKTVDRIFTENLENPSLRMGIITDSKEDQSQVVTLLKDNRILEQTEVITIENMARNKVDISKYDVVVVGTHPNSNDSTKSITALNKIDWSQSKRAVLVYYKYRQEFTESYKVALLELTKKENLLIYDECMSLPDKIKDLQIEMKYMVSNLDVDQIDTICSNTGKNGDIFMRFLDSIFANYDLKFRKVICLTETRDMAKSLKGVYSRLQKKYDRPCFLNTMAYNSSDSKELCAFGNLNNRFVETAVLGSQKIAESIPESGILFGTAEELSSIESIMLRYTDVVILFNHAGLDDRNYTLHIVDSIISSNSTINHTHTDTDNYPFLIVDVYRKLLGKQLSNIYETFYHTNKEDQDAKIRNLIDSGEKDEGNALKKENKLEAYTELNALLEDRTIYTEVKLTKKKREKLESIYSIRRKDYDYINRHNIVYVSTITRAMHKMSTGHLHMLESPYLYLPSGKTGKINGFKNNKNYLERVKARTNELRAEVSAILNSKSAKLRPKNYSGPMWLGKSNGSEIEGSMVGFANEDTDTIEYSIILGTYEFTRTYKRNGWTEKENRDKKILFLSPVFKRDNLSDLKQGLGRLPNRRFSQMEKITFGDLE